MKKRKNAFTTLKAETFAPLNFVGITFCGCLIKIYVCDSVPQKTLHFAN